jgi:hypothetical protein
MYVDIKGESGADNKNADCRFSYHTSVRVGVHKNNFMLQIKCDICKLTAQLSSIFSENRPVNCKREVAVKAVQHFYNHMFSDFLFSHPEYREHCSYDRRIRIQCETFTIKVKRVKNADGSTDAVLFDFMVPYGL